MAYKKGYDIRKTHPGWAVRFEDGTFLGGAHGWFRTKDAFYADVHDTPEDAQRNLDNARHGDEGYYNLKYEIIEAWQPICESLRHDVSVLKGSNTIQWMDIFDLKGELEDILERVKEWETRSHQIKLDALNDEE